MSEKEIAALAYEVIANEVWQSRGQARNDKQCTAQAKGLIYRGGLIMEIKITKTTTPNQMPPEDKLGFGKVFTDHMFVMDYEEG